MTDEEILAAMRACEPRSAVRVAELLDQLYDGGLCESSMVFFFHRAFPDIPFSVLMKAREWERITNCDLSDDGFNELLREWIGEET